MIDMKEFLKGSPDTVAPRGIGGPEVEKITPIVQDFKILILAKVDSSRA